MNFKIMALAALSWITFSCNQPAKDSVEKADSTNKANIDIALTHDSAVVIDEPSSSFLVHASNGSMTEVILASLAQQKAVSPRVKNFGSMLVQDHSLINEDVKNLAAKKNVVLPDSVDDEKKKQITEISEAKAQNFDRAFMIAMVKSHEEAISLFEKAVTEAKDADINSFADKTLMKLKVHLDSAKTIQASLKTTKLTPSKTAPSISSRQLSLIKKYI